MFCYKNFTPNMPIANPSTPTNNLLEKKQEKDLKRTRMEIER